MKRWIFLLMLSTFVFPSTAQTTSSADQILKEACQQAQKENKKVFIVFHASWCGWCREMDSAMNDTVIKSFFDDNYVIRHLTVYERENKKELETPGALALLTHYGGNDQGVPFWMIFDNKGKLMADSQVTPKKNVGCPARPEEVSYFVKVLKKTSFLNNNQLALIEKRFRAIE
jgi:thioredoxin-related protein